jgi:hypothetical protein
MEPYGQSLGLQGKQRGPDHGGMPRSVCLEFEQGIVVLQFSQVVANLAVCASELVGEQ